MKNEEFSSAGILHSSFIFDFLKINVFPLIAIKNLLTAPGMYRSVSSYVQIRISCGQF